VDVRPIVEVTLASDDQDPLPSEIQLTLTWGENGTPEAPVTFFPVPGENAPGDDYLMAVQKTDRLTASGHYSYTVHAHIVFNQGPAVDADLFGTAKVVVRDNPDEPDPFGQGWGIDGVEQLVKQCDGVLWVNGSGDSRWFAFANNYATDGDFVS